MVHESVIIGKETRVSPSAEIEEGCVIGDWCFIGHGVVMRPRTVIGNNTAIAHHVIFEGETTVGSDCLIHDHTQITMGTIIEDKVFIGPGVQTMNDRYVVHRRHHVKPFIVEAPIFRYACRVAGGSIVIPRIIVGRNAFVGAGSLVTKDVPEGQMWFGNPARFIKMVPTEEWL